MSTQNLADQMGVSLNDLMSFAQSIANSIEQHGADGHFIELSEPDQIKITEAYAVHAVKKMNKFVGIYTTNPEARDAFITNIYGQLTKIK